MTEHPPSDPFESFASLELARQRLERRGYYFWAIPKEHSEGLITQPLITKIRATIKRRGFTKVANHGIITFSGFADDSRELFQVPEARRYWAKFDQELLELPAILAVLPQFGFNGAGLYLSFLGEVDEMRPIDAARYDLHIKGSDRLIAQALAKIKRATERHHLSPVVATVIMANFLSGISNRESL